MADWWPTDVALRLEGDKEQSQTLIGLARRVLFKALLQQDAYPVSHSSVTEKMPDGSYITVNFAGPFKTVHIFSPPITTDESTTSATPDIPVILPGQQLGMLHGYFEPKGSSTTTDPITHITTTQVWDYQPTPLTAKLNALKPGRQHTKRLTGVSYANTHSSKWSGAMKRVVQAVMGLGKITDNSVEWLTGLPPPKATRVIPLNYNYVWNLTHGVIKSKDKQFWLVEISQTRGVLAMPLPLFQSTTTPDYHAYLKARGDVETLRVVDEFGGIPSGETFPTDPDKLAHLIAIGKCVQLMMPAQLNPFYVNKTPYSGELGWAFPDTKASVRNTCIGLYLTSKGTGLSQGGNQAQDPTDTSSIYAYCAAHGSSGGELFYTTSEHWSLDFILPVYTPWTAKNPVPMGSCTLNLFHSGKIAQHDLRTIWVPTNAAGEGCQSMALSPAYFGAAALYCEEPSVVPWFGEKPGFGADIHVFYDGDRLERVKWVRGGNFSGLSRSNPTNPFPFTHTEDWWYSVSPFGFVSTSFDYRGKMSPAWGKAGGGGADTTFDLLGGSVTLSALEMTDIQYAAMSTGQSQPLPVGYLLPAGFYGCLPAGQTFALSQPQPSTFPCYSLIIPSNSRESYVICVDGPQPFGRDVFDEVTGAANYPYADPARLCVAYVPGVGIVNIPSPTRNAHFPLTGRDIAHYYQYLPAVDYGLTGGGSPWDYYQFPKAVKCAVVYNANLSTGGYIISCSRNDDTTPPYTRKKMPPSFAGVLPENMNWIGSP